MNPLERALLEAVPGLEVRADDDTRAVYGHDESDTADFLPELVAFPRSTEQVSEVLRACNRLGVPVTPVAARSGKSGRLAPAARRRLAQPRADEPDQAISAEDLTAIVEPGVVTGDLMKAVEAQGCSTRPTELLGVLHPRSQGNGVRFLPPLNISDADMDLAISIFEKAAKVVFA